MGVLHIVAGILLYVLGKRWLASLASDMSKVKRVPGGHWLWGHEKDAWAMPDGGFYVRNVNQLGHAFVMKAGLFHPDILTVTDPAALTHMFTKRPYVYIKSQIIRPLIERLLGRSLPWAEGDDHKRQRQMLAPAFSAEAVKGMDEVIRQTADKLVDTLREHVHSERDGAMVNGKGPGAGVRVNILNWSCRATLDIIGRVGFGYDFKCGKSPEAQAIQASWQGITKMGLEMAGFAAPLVIRAFPFITDLPVAAIQAQGEIKLIIKKLAREIVERRKMAGENGAKGEKDLLSVMMRMHEAQGEDFDQLLDHIVTFVMVGHETTSATINFALLELAKRPDLQDRLRREVTEFNGAGPGGEPTYEEFISKLRFLDAICKETLRMYPAASHTERIAQEDDILPLRFPITSVNGEEMTSIRIKKGQLISVPTLAVGRNARIWGPDAEVFNPDRWLSPESLPPPTSLSQGYSGLFSFIEGPRICIGHRLAMFEIKVILASLIKNFNFDNTGATIVTQFSSTLQPYVVGRLDEGVQIPLIVKDLHQ